MSSKSTKEDNPRWKWEETPLIHAGTTDLSLKDMKQLGATRNVQKRDLNATKVELAARLISFHDINLSRPLKTYTVKQLKPELKLRGLDDSNAKKSILISRFSQKPIKTIHVDKWIFQKSPPNLLQCRNVMLLNDQEICVADDYEFNKYNIISKKWTQWLSYDKHRDRGYQYHQSICDRKNIYTIFDASPWSWNSVQKCGYEIFKTDIRTQNCSKIIHFSLGQSDFEISRAKLTVLHNQFHVIRRDSGMIKHFVLNEDTKRYETLHTFDDIQLQQLTNHTAWGWANTTDKFDSAELITIPINNMMLFIIDFDIYIYSGNTYKWSKSTLKITNNLNLSKHAITMNGRYILIFGQHVYGKKECIHIIDLNTMKLMKSIKTIPVKQSWYIKCKAVIANSPLEQKVVVFGYVRQCWKSKEFELMIMPPDYIIRLISLWCCMENVHLFIDTRTANIHCMIAVDQILKNMYEVPQETKKSESKDNEYEKDEKGEECSDV